MKKFLNDEAVKQLFEGARSYNKFTDIKIEDSLIKRLYSLFKWAPTSMNSQPARFLFIQSEEARKRLLPALIDSNVEKTRKAPLTVIVAMDTEFFEHLPNQFTAYDAAPMFKSNKALADSTAFRNSSLQGAYLIMAARSLGLDCGAMSGFDPVKVNAEFFPDGRLSVNFIINIGYGAEDGYHPRGPRLDFDQVAQVI